MEYQSASQKDEIQTRASTWTSLEDTMPSEGKWLQKSTQYVTPLTCRGYGSQIHGTAARCGPWL